MELNPIQVGQKLTNLLKFFKGIAGYVDNIGMVDEELLDLQNIFEQEYD